MTSSDADGSADIVIVDADTVQLRAEWLGNASGRTYTLTYEATDACGNETTATATVTVLPASVLYTPVLFQD